MASWRSPPSSGVKVLNSGMIQVGAMNCTASMNAVAAIQHQSHASGPAHSKNARMTASSSPPRTTASAVPFRRSAMKVPGVVRLNPYRASTTKVDHARNGSPRRVDASARAPMYASPVTTGPWPSPRTAVSSHAKPPPNQNASTTARSNAPRRRPKRVRVAV